MGEGISTNSRQMPNNLSARKPPSGAGFEIRSRSSAQMRTLGDEAAQATPFGRPSPQMTKNASSKTMGIPGYYVAKHGLPRKEPNYTIPKDEN
mmetsp:Transcript_9907/g.12297  ORF Transcript_9907/g.12297 Transcript_9907/m.12297 type:complete len:93 (+) Transcript_9907:248-526(+)